MTENRPRVLLLESIHPVARESLTSAGFEVDVEKGALGEAALSERLGHYDVVGIRSKTRVTAKALANAKRPLAIGAFCIGTNQIDLTAAASAGVQVFNAPFSNTRSVAELVIAEIVMLSRHLGDRVREMHQGAWRKIAKGAHEIRGKTLGIVGYGHIGRQVGVLAEAFGMRVVFFDIVAQLPMGNNESLGSLEQVLERSDFVTLHVPETPQTANMIGAPELRRMRQGASLINASRGTVVDLDALAEALKSGHVGGAAVDVFPEEPEENESEGFRSALSLLPNVIMTPHIGGSTLEAQEAIGREVSATLIRALKTGATTGAVNFPEVELARVPNTHRVAHVHRNVPGVLRDVNRIVSELDANVQAQVLATTATIGYLLMDMDKAVAGQVCQALGALETTIRARVVY